jgi:hypothetical protein
MQTQCLSRLAPFHRARSGQRRPGGLKPALRASPEFASLGGFPSFAKRATPPRWAEALLFAAIRVGVFSALGFVLAKGNPRFAGSLVCVVLCFYQC